VQGGAFEHIRIALGGVGTRPWRSRDAEKALEGQPASEVNFQKAAQAALRGARPQSQNGFKVELAKRCIVHALKLATT
jgi:xanthine dehydrogenase YagS FAD-binding subunit